MKPEDLRATYRALFNTDDGQEVLKDLQIRFHIHRPVFSTDAAETAFRDGQRSVVLMVQSFLSDTPPTITEEIDIDG